MSSCAPHVCKNLWKTELVLDPLELELQRLVSNRVSSRKQTWDFCKSSSTQNSGATSLASWAYNLKSVDR